MGKIRRHRKSYHLQAAKNADADEKSTAAAVSEKYEYGRLEDSSPLPILSFGNADAAMFKNLKIEAKDLIQQLPESGASVPTPPQCKPSQPLKKMHKRERMKHRRATFLNKIEAIVDAGKKAAATKKRRNTAIIGDVHPMVEALPEINKPKVLPKRTLAAKIRPVKKFKARQQQMMDDILAFKQVRSHPAFQQDPEGTIFDHLHNKLKAELM